MDDRHRLDIACSLMAPVVDPSVIERTRALTDPSDDDALVVLLLQRVPLGIDTPEPATRRLAETMTVLERIFDVDAVAGGRLMAALHAHADLARAHAVCDGIELWFDAARSRELADALTRLGRGLCDEAQEERYARWAASIRSRHDDASPHGR